MTTQTHAQQLANRFAKLNYNNLTPESRHAVKRLLLDYLGVALAGGIIGGSAPVDVAQASRLGWILVAGCGIAVLLIALASRNSEELPG